MSKRKLKPGISIAEPEEDGPGVYLLVESWENRIGDQGFSVLVLCPEERTEEPEPMFHVTEKWMQDWTDPL